MVVVALALRWLAVFAGATAGSWVGRQAASRLYGELAGARARLDARTLLEQDVGPGFLAAELLGRRLKLGLAGEIAVAALGAAAASIATGPFVQPEL